MYIYFDKQFNHERKVTHYEIMYYNINFLIYYLLQLVILITCGYLLYIGKISIAIFLVIESYLWRIGDVVESISDFEVNFSKVAVSLNRIDEIVNNRLYQDEQFGNINLEQAKGIIEFKNASFKYHNDESLTLKNLNLQLDSSKKIAIIGRTLGEEI